MANFKFPEPNEIAGKFDSCFRESEDMIKIYNKESGAEEAKRMSQAVRKWIRVEAAKKGWAEVVFPTDYENAGAYFGAVFIRAAAEDSD